MSLPAVLITCLLHDPACSQLKCLYLHLVETVSGNAGSPDYPGVCYAHLLPRDIPGELTDEIAPRLCLSTFGFHVVINAQSSRFFKLPLKKPYR